MKESSRQTGTGYNPSDCTRPMMIYLEKLIGYKWENPAFMERDFGYVVARADNRVVHHALACVS